MAEMRTLLSAETIDRDRIEQHRAARHAQAEQMSKLMTRTLADLAEVLTPAQRSEAAKSLTRMGGVITANPITAGMAMMAT
jgi:protein CpxP